MSISEITPETRTTRPVYNIMFYKKKYSIYLGINGNLLENFFIFQHYLYRVFSAFSFYNYTIRKNVFIEIVYVTAKKNIYLLLQVHIMRIAYL